MAKAMRTSISVPPELKARMDAVGEPVNWSAVACRAFEEKLVEIINRKEIRDMKDVVTRLRASKQKLDEGRRKEGYAAGERWAKQRADAEELVRLQTLREGTYGREYEWDTMWVTGESSAYTPGEHFVFAIRPEFNGDRSEAYGFWDTVIGPDYESRMSDPEFVRGFADGALDVWGEVKDQL